MIRVAFTVRKTYFHEIAAGTKTREVRRASPYWRAQWTRVRDALDQGEPVEATFLSGPMWHRRKIVNAILYPDARTALGRDPSKQGQKDLGDGAVIGFDLGEVVPP
jgi:hypothetical protein